METLVEVIINRAICVACLLALVLVQCKTGLAQARQTRTVVVDGYGVNVSAAARNAAENALKQIVGSFILTEMYLKKKNTVDNGIRRQTKNINTNTYEYSRGVIQSFNILKISKRDQMMQVTAKIEVRVSEFEAFVGNLIQTDADVPVGVVATIQQGTSNENNRRRLVLDKIVNPLLRGTATKLTIQEMGRGKSGPWRKICKRPPSIFGDFCKTLRHNTILVKVLRTSPAAWLAETVQILQNTATARASCTNANCVYHDFGGGFPRRFFRATQGHGVIGLERHVGQSLEYAYYDLGPLDDMPSELSDFLGPRHSIGDGNQDWWYRKASSTLPALKILLLDQSNKPMSLYKLLPNSMRGGKTNAVISSSSGSNQSCRRTSRGRHRIQICAFGGWFGLRNFYSQIIRPRNNFWLSLNLPPDELARLKRIKLELDPQAR
jgi:hypothetical protein